MILAQLENLEPLVKLENLEGLYVIKHLYDSCYRTNIILPSYIQGPSGTPGDPGNPGLPGRVGKPVRMDLYINVIQITHVFVYRVLQALTG